MSTSLPYEIIRRLFYSGEMLWSRRETDYQRELCWRVYHEEWITLSETSRDREGTNFKPFSGPKEH